MREHPIPPVTELLQYRAIGLVRGKYKPENAEIFSRGSIIDKDGEEIETVVLGKALGLIKRLVSIEDPHLWVVYPRCRDAEHLHLQIAGIWEPSTLVPNIKSGFEDKNNKSSHHNVDEVFEGDDFFSLRGELIYTKPEKKELVLKIRQKPRKNNSKSFPFKLSLNGEISLDCLRQFVSLDARRVGQKLYLENSELIGPLKNISSKKSKKLL